MNGQGSSNGGLGGVGAIKSENRLSSSLPPPQHKAPRAASVQTKIKTPYAPVQTPKPKTRTHGSGVHRRSNLRSGSEKQAEVGPDLDSTRSKNDKKRYRMVTLANGLQVLLISTTDAPESKVGVLGSRQGSVTIPSSMDMHFESGDTEGKKSRPVSYVREFGKHVHQPDGADRPGRALADPSMIPRQSSYRTLLEEELDDEGNPIDKVSMALGSTTTVPLNDVEESPKTSKRKSRKKSNRSSRGANSRTLPRKMMASSNQSNSSSISHQRSKSTGDGLTHSAAATREHLATGDTLKARRAFGSGVVTGGSRRAFGSGAPSSSRPASAVIPRPLHNRVDSTAAVVDQIHAHAVSTSQQGLNQDAAGAVGNAAAALAAKHPGLKNRLSQSSVLSNPSGSLRTKKVGGFSSLTREQSKLVANTATRQRGAQAAAQAAALASSGGVGAQPLSPGNPPRRRDSGRSVGSELLGAPALASRDDRRRSLGRKRQSIPSITLSSSSALPSMGHHRNRLSTHMTHSHGPGGGMERTNSRSSMLDVPHLDHPTLRTDSKRLTSTSLFSSAATVGGVMDNNDDSLDGTKEFGLRMAAVSLSVGVGSFSTPEGFDGLAHFLEHMLFMGSEKYPTENAFDAFLSQAGGNSNAYTDTEKTVYHFTCPQEHLAQALDIFAQFFVAPLLLPESADRELKSIESEFTLRQNMDGCRLQEIWRHTSRKETPFSKFTCGNNQTLRDWPRAAGRDVNKALWDFFKQHYVGANMKLCILGIDSLDNLQELATNKFISVPKRPPGVKTFRPIEFAERGVPWIGPDPSVQSLAQVWPQIIKAQKENKKLPDVLNDLEVERQRERKRSSFRRREAMSAAAAAVRVGEDHPSSRKSKSSSASRSLGRRSRKRSKSKGRHGPEPAPENEEANNEPVVDAKPGVDGVALGCLFRIVPVQDMHELSLTWQLPPLAGLYMSKPTEYISHLVGHESQGSILAEAKSRGWATALIASSTTGDGFEHNTACTMFNINITLTRQGLNEWVYVVGMVFEYIGMLLRVGPQQWVHDELQAVSKMQYEFQEEPDALMLAQNLSVWMLPQSKYKPEHILTGPWLNFEWDPVLITNTLHQLSPKLVRVDLMSSVYGHSDEYNKSSRDPEPSRKQSSGSIGRDDDLDGGDLDDVHRLADKPTTPPLVEPFTGAQYWADRIPDSIINLWKELYFNRATVGFTESATTENEASGSQKTNNLFPRSLALPPRNPYISTDFSLKPIHAVRPHPLTNSLIRVRRPVEQHGSVLWGSKTIGSLTESNSLMSRLSKRHSKLSPAFLNRVRGQEYEWVRAKILEFNHRDNMVLVRYPHGEFRWHELPKEKVDWGSVPSPSSRRVSLIKNLHLDSKIEFQLLQLGSSTGTVAGSNRNGSKEDSPHLAHIGTDDSFNTESVGGGSFDHGPHAQGLGGNWRSPHGRKSGKHRPRSHSESRGRKHWHSSSKRDPRRSSSRRRRGRSEDRYHSPRSSSKTRPSLRSNSRHDEASVSDVSLSDLDEDNEFGEASNQDSDSNNSLAGFPTLPTKSRTPAMVAHSDKLFTLWHLHDQEFLSPRCEVYLNFMSPVANASPLVASLHDLLALMVFESLNQDSYMAFISELELEIETSGTGLQVHVGGFSHKLPVLLDNVLNKLLQFAMLDKDPDQVKRIVTELKNDSGFESGVSSMSPMQLVESPVFYAQLESLVTNYINAGSQFRSSGQVSTAMFQILCSDLWSPDIKVTYAAYITPDLLKEYAVKFLSECRVTGLVQGNVTLDDAQNIMSKVKNALGTVGMKPISDDELPVLKVMTVPPAAPLVKNATISGLVHVLEALESPAHSVELYFQIGDDVLEDRILASMIEQLMKEPLYAELRTKQQLGYSVKCGVRSICGTLGYVVEITSEVHGPELLTKDVDDFLSGFRSTLEELSEAALAQNLAALARNVLEKDNGLGEAALKAWSTITNKQYHKPPRYAWNYELEQARALRSKVTKEKIINAYDKWLNPASDQRRRLSVLVVGYGYNTTNLVRMLELPCVQIVESSNDAQPHRPSSTKACKCSIM